MGALYLARALFRHDQNKQKHIWSAKKSILFDLDAQRTPIIVCVVHGTKHTVGDEFSAGAVGGSHWDSFVYTFR